MYHSDSYERVKEARSTTPLSRFQLRCDRFSDNVRIDIRVVQKTRDYSLTICGLARFLVQ